MHIFRRSKNVPVDQSQNKPKILKDKERGEYYQWWRFDGPKEDKNTNSVLLPDDVLNDMKQMNPQQLAKFLSVTVFCHGLVTKLFSAEASCCQLPSETNFVDDIVQYSDCNVRQRN